jgi:hypothetical protein
MKRQLTFVLVAGVVGLGLAACGPDNSETAAPPRAGAASATHASPTQSTATGTVTPDQLCGMIGKDRVSQLINAHITSTTTDVSGKFAVCQYRTTVDGNQFAAVIVEYGPEGKTAIEYTKNNGAVPVSGVGQFAIWWPKSGEFAAEVGSGEATFHIFMMDVRLNHGNIKAAATNIAKAVVPQLPQT